MTARPVEACQACVRGWRHCHEAWVEHRTGGECTGHDGCDEPAEAHAETVPCTDVDAACDCR